MSASLRTRDGDGSTAWFLTRRRGELEAFAGFSRVRSADYVVSQPARHTETKFM
jgi:hypothetical protein